MALVIADDARDQNRVSWITLPLLCARARLKPSSVRAALAKLASRGLEFRVPHGYGKDGRPVFATKNHAVDYAVPDLIKGASPLAPITAAGPVDNPPPGAPRDTPKALGIEPKALENGSKGARELAPLLLRSPQYPSTEALDVGATPVEAPARDSAAANKGARELAPNEEQP